MGAREPGFIEIRGLPAAHPGGVREIGLWIAPKAERRAGGGSKSRAAAP
jgi:hypothetical protein